MIGHKQTEETKQKIRQAKLGKTREITWGDSLSKSLKGRQVTWGSKIASSLKGVPLSDERKQKISDTLRKKNNIIKGIVLQREIKRLRKSRKASSWRKSVLERDNYTCQECGSKECNFHADHLHPICLIIKEIVDEVGVDRFLEIALKDERLWDIANGRTLCEKCHRKTDTYGRTLSFYMKSETL